MFFCCGINNHPPGIGSGETINMGGDMKPFLLTGLIVTGAFLGFFECDSDPLFFTTKAVSVACLFGAAWVLYQIDCERRAQ